MTEKQAAEIITILNSIDSRLYSIESATSSSNYDLGDVCSKLSNIEKAIEKMG